MGLMADNKQVIINGFKQYWRRCHIAGEPNLPASLVTKFVKDTTWEVRFGFANPNVVSVEVPINE